MVKTRILSLLLALLLLRSPAFAREAEDIPVVRELAEVPGHISLVEGGLDVPVMPEFDLTLENGEFTFIFEPGAYTFLDLEAKYTDDSVWAYDEDNDGLITGVMPGDAKERADLSSIRMRIQHEDHYFDYHPLRSVGPQVQLMRFFGKSYESFIWENGMLNSWGYTSILHPVTGQVCEVFVYYDEEGMLEQYYYKVGQSYAHFDRDNLLKSYMNTQNGKSIYYRIDDGKWIDSLAEGDTGSDMPGFIDPALCTPIPIAFPEPEQP